MKDITGSTGQRRTRRVWLLSVAVGVLLAGFLVGQVSRAASVPPGSDLDPLISQSYLDQYVQLQVIELAAGQRLEGAGGTQLIVRAGPARAIASAQGGLCDVTAGKDLANNERIALNHLLVVPRTDGRGILAEGRVFVMVRGPFAVK